MDLIAINEKIIKEISDTNSKNFVDLPKYFRQFEYPLSLDTVEHLGHYFYEEDFADINGFLAILTTKIYTSIIQSKDVSTISYFLFREDPYIFRSKTSKLILAVKKFIQGKLSSNEFINELKLFLKNTYGVRLPVLSFFLRVMRPDIFATIDIHALAALKKLGFKGIITLPEKEISKEKYIDQKLVEFYLLYNELLTEIGRHYQLIDKNGASRFMWPSEVDMALYMYDKAILSVPKLVQQSISQSIKDKKIKQFLIVIDEIVSGVFEVANQDWAKKTGQRDMLISSANKLKNIMYEYAKKGELDKMWQYYERALGDATGRNVGRILKDLGKKSLESEYSRVRKIVEDP